MRIPQGQLYMGMSSTGSPASQTGGLTSSPVPESDGVDMLSRYGGYDTYDQYGSEYDPYAPAEYAPEMPETPETYAPATSVPSASTPAAGTPTAGAQPYVPVANDDIPHDSGTASATTSAAAGTNTTTNTTTNTDDVDITASVIVRGPNGRPASGNIPPSKHTGASASATSPGNANGSYINVPAYTDDAGWGDAGQNDTDQNDTGQTDQPADGTDGSQPPAPQPAPQSLPNKSASAKGTTGKGNTGKSKTGKSKPSSAASRRHTSRVIAVAAIVCIIAILIGVSVTRMFASGQNSSTSNATSSASASSGKSTGTTKANGAKQSGKSTQSASGSTGKKTDKQSTEQSDKQADKQTETNQTPSGPYINARFGYTVTVPAGFTWQQESDNGDGRQFTNDGLGMIITVSGISNATNATLDDEFATATAGHPVSYQQKLGTEFTATWEENGTITYIRELYSADTLRTLRFDYPASHRDQCDRIVEQVVPTFGITGTDLQ